MDKKYLKYLQQFTGAGDKIVEINLQYYKRDFLRLITSIMSIENLSSKNESIPLDLAKQLVDIFKKPIIDEYRKYKKLENKHKKFIIHFAEKKGYNFDINGLSLVNFLEDNINQIIDLFETEKDKGNTTKINVIAYSFNRLHNYLSLLPKSKQPSFHSYTIIVGIICLSFQLIDTEDVYKRDKSTAKSYIEYLNNCTKHICERENNKKEKPIPKYKSKR